jgi:hypothetical protein
MFALVIFFRSSFPSGFQSLSREIADTISQYLEHVECVLPIKSPHKGKEDEKESARIKTFRKCFGK